VLEERWLLGALAFSAINIRAQLRVVTIPDPDGARVLLKGALRGTHVQRVGDVGVLKS